MRLYAAYILCSLKPDPLLLAGAFFLTLSIYSLDRIEDYGGRIIHPILFYVLGSGIYAFRGICEVPLPLLVIGYLYSYGMKINGKRLRLKAGQ